MINRIEDVKPDDVMSVYSGKRDHCCCGCAGNHRYHPKHVKVASKDRGYKVTPDEVSMRSVNRILNWMKRNPSNIDMVPHMKGKIPYNFFSAVNGGRMYIVYLLP